MKILLVGSPRTGSVTINSVLDELGFGPCYHGWTFYVNRTRDMPFWKKAYALQTLHRTHEINWDEIFMNYQSCSDIPTIFFYKDICRQYPNMKVILNIRDEQKWCKSFAQSLGKILGNPFIDFCIHKILFKVAGDAYVFLTFMNKMGFYPLFMASDDGWRVFHTKPKENEKYMIEQYKKRNNDVIEYFKNENMIDRLFILDWERKDKNAMFFELMKYLDVQLSENAIEKRLKQNEGSLFPHKNNTNTMRMDVCGIISKFAVYFIMIVVAVVVVVVFVCKMI